MLDIEGRQRAAVVAEARSWIGTPYHNCADIKGAGVDCGMLLVRVFVDTGLCPPFDPRPYPADWHLHRGEERYLGFIFDRCCEVAQPLPGDVMVLRYGRCYSHGGIVTRPNPLTMVHAFHPARRVLEEEVEHNSQLSEAVRVAALLQLLGEEAMSGLFGGGSQPTTTPDYTGLQIQTAVNTLPIPIVWGESRLAPNIVWYNNFQTYESSGGGKGSGGKGGLFSGGGGGSVSYTYSAAIIMALCEGPIAGINQVWKNQSVYTLSELGLSLFAGTTPQSEWSYIATAYPSQALAYQGTAYLCAPNYSLGDSATLDNHNFEVQGFFYGTGYGPGYATGADADPSLVVSDFLTNAQYGVGFPQASIDATTLFGSGGDASYQTYCRAVGLALSPALTDQERASSHPRAVASAHKHRRGLVGRALEVHSLRRQCRQRQRHHVQSERHADLQSRRR